MGYRVDADSFVADEMVEWSWIKMSAGIPRPECKDRILFRFNRADIHVLPPMDRFCHNPYAGQTMGMSILNQ